MADPYAELQQQVQAIIDHGPGAGFGPEAVNSLIENMDMREAQRSYSANVSVLEVTRGMLTRIIETLG